MKTDPKVLKDAYEKYRAEGFVLKLTKKHEKSTRYQGKDGKVVPYRSYKPDAFTVKATGYAAIIPDNLIIVDNDKYEVGNEFSRLVKTLGYTPVPFAITPSGGEHYAFRNESDGLVPSVGHGFKYIDIYGGFKSIIPIVGTVVKNKKGELNCYEWADPIDEELFINPWDERLTEIFAMKPTNTTGGAGTTFDEDAGLELAIYNDPNNEKYFPDSEVDDILENIIPANLEWDEWFDVGKSIAARYHGTNEGKEKWLKFCAKSPEKNDPSHKGYVDPADKWDVDLTRDTKATYIRLRRLGNKYRLLQYTARIKHSTSDTQLIQVMEDIRQHKDLQTSDFNQDPLGILSTMIKGVSKGDMNLRMSKEAIRNAIDFKYTAEPTKHIGVKPRLDEVKVYLHGNGFVLVVKDMYITNLNLTAYKRHLNMFGFTKKEIDVIGTEGAISDVKHELNYNSDTAIKFDTRPSKLAGMLDVMTVEHNPLHGKEAMPYDDRVVKAFFDDIWQGRADDVLKLVGLSIRFNETKLNKLVIIAPSSSGKSDFLKQLNFVPVEWTLFKHALKGGKGIGPEVISDLRNTGLLLVDEIEKPLGNDVRLMDGKINLEKFGAGGGTQVIKLMFSVFTTTHANAISGLSDELRNRIMAITVPESGHKVGSSAIFKEVGQIEYTASVINRSYEILLDALRNPEYDEDMLRTLQEKYFLDKSNEIDELLDEVHRDFKNYITAHASTSDINNEIFESNNIYYVNHKRNLKDVLSGIIASHARDLPISIPKYANKLMDEAVSRSRKMLTVNGKKIQRYPVNADYIKLSDGKSNLFDDVDDNVEEWEL